MEASPLMDHCSTDGIIPLGNQSANQNICMDDVIIQRSFVGGFSCGSNSSRIGEFIVTLSSDIYLPHAAATPECLTNHQTFPLRHFKRKVTVALAIISLVYLQMSSLRC